MHTNVVLPFWHAVKRKIIKFVLCTCSDVNYLRAQVGMQLISLINKVTGLEYDMHLRTWCNTRSLFNFWEIRARLKNTLLYLMSIECVYGCSVVDWLSRCIRPQPFPQCRTFYPKLAWNNPSNTTAKVKLERPFEVACDSRCAFLKSPETFRVNFEHDNSHCIL